MIRRLSLGLLAGSLLWMGAGCATVPLDAAFSDFNRGNLDSADQRLAAIPDGPDAVRHLMERGMIRHLRQDYAGSTADWERAIRLEEALETHSVSKAGASMLVNDSVLAYRGPPFERTYLHVFQARNYLARGLWDGAGVEARNIIRRQEKLNGFPDDAYSRYLAALCLSLSGDEDGAAYQYQLAASLAPAVQMDPVTGRFPSGTAVSNAPSSAPSGYELVCLVDVDGGSLGHNGAELYADGRFLGLARILADTATLAATSREKMATRQIAKTVARVALKESIAAAVSIHNEDLGEAVRALLFAVETPDQRSWRTLPRQLAVARVPCPPDLRAFEVVFRDGFGTHSRRITVTAPIARHGRTFVSFCRDYP